MVLFGEMLPLGAFERAEELARRCEVCLVIGTSAVVYPAASLPEIAASNGAAVCQFDVEATGLTHQGIVRWFVEGKAGETLPRLL